MTAPPRKRGAAWMPKRLEPSVAQHAGQPIAYTRPCVWRVPTAAVLLKLRVYDVVRCPGGKKRDRAFCCCFCLSGARSTAYTFFCFFTPLPDPRGWMPGWETAFHSLTAFAFVCGQTNTRWTWSFHDVELAESFSVRSSSRKFFGRSSASEPSWYQMLNVLLPYIHRYRC